MIVRPQIEIKKLVVRTFIELGVPSRCLFQMEESSVIRSGTCAARNLCSRGSARRLVPEEGPDSLF